MPEPTKTIGDQFIVISPDDPQRRRTWPNPRSGENARWKAVHTPDALTRDEVRELARMADAYRYLFSIPQREFTPTHAAIRAALAAGEVSP